MLSNEPFRLSVLRHMNREPQSVTIRIDYYAVVAKSPIKSHRMRSIAAQLRQILLIVAFGLVVSACVYRVDVQQGNLLEDHDIDAVQIGMTRSQVLFLLGTPVVRDSFHRDRWDYIYYFRKGRSRNADRSWLIVFFEGDRVKEIEPDVAIDLG